MQSRSGDRTSHQSAVQCSELPTFSLNFCTFRHCGLTTLLSSLAFVQHLLPNQLTASSVLVQRAVQQGKPLMKPGALVLELELEQPEVQLLQVELMHLHLLLLFLCLRHSVSKNHNYPTLPWQTSVGFLFPSQPALSLRELMRMCALQTPPLWHHSFFCTIYN